MRKILALFLLTLLPLSVCAQEKPEVTVNADFISHYVWRGKDLGHVSVQPALGVKWRGLSVLAGGNAGVTQAEDPQEIDVTASYTIGGLSFGVVDYWSDAPDSRYFYYNSHGTSHTFEGFVAYDFGVLSASWQTAFAGIDGENNSGKRAYSSYVELQAPFNWASFQWTATLGIVPFATTSYETDGFAVTHVRLKAAKSVEITDHFSLPVFGEFVANPCTGKAWLVFGLTLGI